jgi:hypothetical protein
VDKTTNTKENQEIITEYFESLYSNKLEKLKEMDKFLDTYNHPKSNQEDINNLSRSVTCNEIEAAMKCLSNQKSQVLIDSLLNSTRHLN